MVGIFQVGHRRTQYVLCQVQIKKILGQVVVMFSKYSSCFASITYEAQGLVGWTSICYKYAKYFA
jgi:hypothetical protein